MTTSVSFLGKTLSSPLVLASGIWGTTASLMARAAAAGCGAVTAKSCGPTPRAGHVNPSCVAWEHGLINAIGLANPGVEEEVALLTKTKAALQTTGTALIASIFAGPPEEFQQVAATVALAAPDFIEVNISCPNVHSEFGEPYAADPAAAALVTRHVKAGIAEALQQRTDDNSELATAPSPIPIIVKLAPNVPSIGRIARAVVDAGADALCVINTMPGLLIDAESRQTILANRSGGISGPALKPIALKCVYDVYRACPEIPIIGTGGVTTGTDVVEMMMAGATAVGVGSAIYERGPNAISLIKGELEEWLTSHEISDVMTIWAAAHHEPQYATMPTGAPIPTAH